MSKLSKEEVLHVANLARLELTDKEIEDYAVKLKEILDEIDKIQDVSVTTEEIMISPNDNECILSDDEIIEEINIEDALKNVPEVTGDYIAVRGVFE